MYATSIQDIENPFLHDAALVLSLRENDKGEKIFKFRSLYMDNLGECAISYYGILPKQQIKEIMLNFCYPLEDKSFDDITVSDEDYVYTAYIYEDYTTIYTPDSLDYRTLKL